MHVIENCLVLLVDTSQCIRNREVVHWVVNVEVTEVLVKSCFSCAENISVLSINLRSYWWRPWLCMKSVLHYFLDFLVRLGWCIHSLCYACVQNQHNVIECLTKIVFSLFLRVNSLLYIQVNLNSYSRRVQFFQRCTENCKLLTLTFLRDQVL